MNTKIQVQAGRNSFSSLAIIFGLALLSFCVSAAPPNPPVFTALDDQEFDLPSPDGRYSLEDAVRGLPFTVNTPRPPQIAAEQVVTPSTLSNYINTPGMRLILESGDYGNRTFNSQDQQIVLREGVYFGVVNIGGSARRIVIRNEVPRSGNMTNITTPEGGWDGFPEDILIDGIRSDNGGNRNFVNGTRIAFLNSFIRVEDHPLSTFNGTYNDIIVANCNLEAYGSAQSAVRFHNVNRLVFVDNRVHKTGSGHHPFRLHGGDGADIEFAYIGRNQLGDSQVVSINPQGTGTPTSDIFHDIWFEDNDLHAQIIWGGNGFISVGSYEGMLLRFRVRRNNFYGSAPNIIGTPGPSVPNEPGWVIEENRISAFQPSPPWDFR